jgi:hypothetical protein
MDSKRDGSTVTASNRYLREFGRLPTKRRCHLFASCLVNNLEQIERSLFHSTLASVLKKAIVWLRYMAIRSGYNSRAPQSLAFQENSRRMTPAASATIRCATSVSVDFACSTVHDIDISCD